MEIRLDGWAWISKGELGNSQADRLRKNLTIADVRHRRPVLHRAYLEEGDLLGVPRAFFRDSVTKEHEVTQGASVGASWPAKRDAEKASAWYEFQDDDPEDLTLVDSVSGARGDGFFSEEQKVACREILGSLARVNDGIALFESEQSAAKVCLFLIRTLKRKTLIVTPAGNSFSMWQTVINRFLPDAKVGQIRRGEVDIDDRHVVLTTSSDLLSCVRDGKVQPDEFGFIVSHHLHRLDPLEWSSAVGFFRPEKRLGIAELGINLSEGLFRIYSYHLGSPVFAALPDVFVPKVRRVWSSWKISSWVRANPQFISKAALIDQMCLNSTYNQHVVEQVLLALKAERKIVVFSEKLSHLKTIKLQIESEWVGRPTGSDFIVDGMSDEDIEKASESDVILTTFAFAKSLPEMPMVDTVVLATPVRDPIPAASICLVRDPEKKPPVIVDMRCDEVPACKDYGRSRDDAYRRVYGEGEAR